MTDEKFDADVLIVGAGPNGLALATELTMRGHTVRVIEKNDRTGVQPRAKTTNVRTMTQMRRWGLAQKMREQSPLNDDFPRRVSFRTGLFDDPIYSFEDAFCATPQRNDFFPEHAEFIPQYVVEGILAEHVAAQPKADLTFGRKLVDFDQDDEGVTARIVDTNTGAEESVRTKWIVGADGGNSTVRQALGIEMQGTRDMVRFSTLILRIPGLNDDPDLKPALFHWIIDPEYASLTGPMDKEDIWFWSKVSDRDTDVEVLLEHVHRSIGKDYQVEVVTRDDWVVNSLITEQYRKGRAFLVGDACHLHSPFGGHGMNQGIGDSVDLGWKLSAALDGWGTDGLLDSYFIERRQTHQAVVDSATQNVASLSEHFVNPDLKRADEAGEKARAAAAEAIERLKAPEFRSLGLVLGYRYSGSPAIAADDKDAPPLIVTNYQPSGHAGHLAPHAWLEDGASLYDSFSLGFTLLRLGAEDAGGENTLKQLTADANIPLEVVQISLPELSLLYGATYALIRPDQHVAWRGDDLNDPMKLIDAMLGGSGIDLQMKQSA